MWGYSDIAQCGDIQALKAAEVTLSEANQGQRRPEADGGCGPRNRPHFATISRNPLLRAVAEGSEIPCEWL